MLLINFRNQDMQKTVKCKQSGHKLVEKGGLLGIILQGSIR